MKQIDLIISKLMLMGTFLFIIVLILGGIGYLFAHGGETVQPLVFPSETAALTTIRGIVRGALLFSTVDLIQLSLVILLVVQILRVGLTAWLFIKMKDKIFSLISLVIFGILLYLVIWQF